MQNESDGKEPTLIFRGMGVDPAWPKLLERAQRQTEFVIDGVRIPRIRYGKEGRPWPAARRPCHDCAAVKGELHVVGCDMERCPACRGQAICCGCANESIE